MTETKNGTWFVLEEPKGFGLLAKEELLTKVRQEGASVSDEAAIAVFIVNDQSSISYAIDGDDGIIFWEDGCFTPENYDDTCEIVSKVIGNI